jgi:Flp pilus assembly protein TadD
MTSRVAFCILAAVCITCASGSVSRVTAQTDTTESGKLELSTTSEEAKRAFAEGLDAAFSGNAAKARELFRKAREADRTLGLPRIMLALMTEELTDEQRQAEVQEGVEDAFRNSTLELIAALTFRSLITNQEEEVRALLRALTALVPGELTFNYWALQVEAATSDPPARIAAIREFIRKHPDFVVAYNDLGYALLQSGDSAGAELAFQEQLRLAPDQPNPHDSYGELLQLRGKLTEAAQHYRKAIELDSSFGASYVGLAEVEQIRGNGKAARAVLERANNKVTDPFARSQQREALAGSYLYEGDVRRAIAQFEAGLRDAEARNDKYFQAVFHTHLALVNAAFGNGRMVNEHLARARESGAYDESFNRIRLAVALAYAGQPDSAQALADIAMKQSEENPALLADANIVRGWSLVASNQCQAALEAFRGANPLRAAVADLGMLECAIRERRSAEAKTLRDRLAASTAIDYLFDYFPAIARHRQRQRR